MVDHLRSASRKSLGLPRKIGLLLVGAAVVFAPMLFPRFYGSKNTRTSHEQLGDVAYADAPYSQGFYYAEGAYYAQGSYTGY